MQQLRLGENYSPEPVLSKLIIRRIKMTIKPDKAF